jgi:hypothetical protein
VDSFQRCTAVSGTEPQTQYWTGSAEHIGARALTLSICVHLRSSAVKKATASDDAAIMAQNPGAPTRSQSNQRRFVL